MPVTLTSDRSGLVMETSAKVKLRGVQVGRVASIAGGKEPVALKLEIDPDQIQYIPANVEAQIRATTVFGAKYVDLVYPRDPSPQRLAAGAVLQSRNVSTEVNTVFQNLVELLDQIDPAKLNAVLSALADGVRGQGERIGQATTDANQVLLAAEPAQRDHARGLARAQGLQRHLQRGGAGHPATLDAASTTSTTVTSHAKQLDALLLTTIGLSNSGINLLAPESGQPDQGDQRARADDEPAVEVQPRVHLPAGGRQDCWTRAATSARRQRADAGARRRACARRRPLPLSRTTCRSSAPRADPAANRAAARCPTSRRTGRCASSSPTPDGAPGSTCGPTPASASRLGQLPPGHPRGAGAAEHPQPVRRARAGPDPVSGRPGLRCDRVRAGRHAAVAGPAARTTAGRTAGSRPDPGLRAVRGSGARTDAADTVTADPAAAGGSAVAVIARQQTDRQP